MLSHFFSDWIFLTVGIVIGFAIASLLHAGSD